MLVVQRVFGAKRTNLHEKYDYPALMKFLQVYSADPAGGSQHDRGPSSTELALQGRKP